MMALLEAAAAPGYPAEIALVLANRADAAGLTQAAARGVPTALVESRGLDRAAFESKVWDVLDAQRIDIVALAGFMRVLTPGFVRAWEGRMINIHPSLLPAFPGLDTHARALAASVDRHGCTVHLVTASVDEGPVLAQTSVPILPGDTEVTLAARVLLAEHILYPEALARFAANPLPHRPTLSTHANPD